MSPCNTVGLFAVCLALAVYTTNTTAFTVRRTTTIRAVSDEDTRVLHLLNNKPTELNENTTTETKENRNLSEKKNVLLNELATIKLDSTDVDTTSTPPPSALDVNTKATISKKMSNMKSVDVKTDGYVTTAKEFTDTETYSNLLKTKKLKHILKITDKPMNRIVSDSPEVTLPPWKKYSSIIRDRSQLKYMQSDTDTRNRPIELVSSDMIRAATSLRDTLTSDIPSLEKLKNDLLSAASIKQNSRSVKDTVPDTTEQKADGKIGDIEFNISDQSSNHKWDTFESKRAGFLDLSNKKKDMSEITDYNVDDDAPTTFSSTYIENEKNEHDESQNDTIDELNKTDEYNSSKIYEDRADNDYEQKNSMPYPNFSTTDTDYLISDLSNSTEDKLQVKMVNVDRSKNGTLYTVSPNYKPLKKLEVQPPKSFVRDPDDNSWRNESISSLGIVFKPKHSSKPLTQVLKNKTEIEWNSLLDKDHKNDVPDLRERLEQMTKMRKTKRKKTDSMGNVVYIDYEENSGSNENINPSDENIPLVFLKPKIVLDVSQLSPTLFSRTPEVTAGITTSANDTKNVDIKTDVEQKHKEILKLPDYYENADEDETDYLNLAKIDIKKFTVTQKTTDTPVIESTWPILNYEPAKNTMSDRKGTIQYFPPLTTKRNNRKFSTLKTTNQPITRKPVSHPATTTPAIIFSKYQATSNTDLPITNKPTTTDTDFFLIQTPRMDVQSQYKVNGDEGNSNKGSYVIKSYAEYVNEAANDYHGDVEYRPHTESSSPSITANEVLKEERVKDHYYNEDMDYEAQFRKDVLNRFVDNFNSNSERFKPDYPVIFNSSIVHHSLNGGQGVASSRSFLRGLYEVATKTQTQFKHKPYDPNCENVTVELQPAYELQYYLPEQEEKEEVVTLPFQYKL